MIQMIRYYYSFFFFYVFILRKNYNLVFTKTNKTSNIISQFQQFKRRNKNTFGTGTIKHPAGGRHGFMT